MTFRFAVLGNPIKQSQSPLIHSQFAHQLNHQIDYQRQLLEPEGFDAFVTDFFAQGGSGLNVTTPFKSQAFDIAGRLTERAQLAEAVNTLFYKDGVIIGDTTDGYGLVIDITENLQWQLKGKRILVLGAGGAVRGVLRPLLDEEPALLHIANRTASKAAALAETYAKFGAVSSSGFDEIEPGFDVVINGTSSGLSAQIPAIPESVVANACCYDMVYSADTTAFNQWALSNGAHSIADGLGMLVGQAAESYSVWMGVRPVIKPVLALLREKLQSSKK